MENQHRPHRYRSAVLGTVAALGIVSATGAGGWLLWQRFGPVSHSVLPHGTAYTADGYGGFVPKKADRAALSPAVRPNPDRAAKPSPVRAENSTQGAADLIAPAQSAYATGRYERAEAVARQVLAKTDHLLAPKPGTQASEKVVASNTAVRHARVQAQHLLAFTAARQKKLEVARERFAVARKEASALLPEERKERPAPVQLGQPAPPTLEEDAAYQHAVCTMALGEKQAAEREFVAFMRAYPESPLVHASMRRIARLHGGDVPLDAEAVWRRAQNIQQANQSEERRRASLCGPECLAELLRRRGEEKESVDTLAREMKTEERGTALSALQAAARRHGFPDATGVQLSAAGLCAQAMPVIALLSPGHFVLVEKIDTSSGAVTYWDANGQGIGKAAVRTIRSEEWKSLWNSGNSTGGIALTLKHPQLLEKVPASGRIARR